MKKFLLLLTLFCAIFTGTVNATEVEIGVDDATVAKSTVLPINALWKYGWSQQIYTADEIGMAGTINSITFQMYHTGSNPPVYNISVYMMEVDEENFATNASWIPLSEDELVFSGTAFSNLPTTEANIAEVTVELDDPFVYSGSSNLVIAFANNTGSYVSGLNTLAFGASSGPKMSLYKYQDSGVIGPDAPTVTGTLTHLRNVITLDITAGGGGPTCDKPSAITPSDTTANSMTITWAGGSGVYNVEYKAADDTVWTPVLAQSLLFSTTLNNLEPNTSYQARVQSCCSDTVSSWRICNFKTACASITSFPWSEDFESYAANAIPDCWDNTASSSYASTSTKYYIWGIISGSNNKSMRLYNSMVKSGTAFITSPDIVMPATGSYELSFDYVHAANCGPFKVLVSENDGLSWDTIGTYEMTTASTSTTTPSSFPNEAVISLDNYIGQTIQLQFYADANYSSGAIWVDNLAIYDASCVKPADLAAGAITTTSIELSWEADPVQTAWQLEYKKSAENAWTPVQVTTNPYTLTGLDVYTAYDFRVAAKCGENISKYSNVISAKTAAKVPFAEAFTSLPSDWKRYAVALDSVWGNVDTLANHPVTTGWTVASGNGVFGTNHLKLRVYGTDVKHWIVSPYIEMDDNMQLSFDLALTKYSGSLQPAEAGQQDDDKFYVLITTDDGANWDPLYVRDNQTTEDSYDAINCSADGQTVKIDLTSYATGRVAFAFYGESSVAGGDNYLHIRNLNIDTIPSCEKPEALELAAILDTLVSFTWDEVEGATWAYGLVRATAAFVPTDADFVGSTEGFTLTIDTLQENTDYIFFLRRDCGGSHSDYVARQFTSLPAPLQVPWSENFESMDNNTVPVFWDNSASITTTVAGTNKHYVWGVYTYGGNKMIRMYNYMVQSGTALINTPYFVLPETPGYELTFDYAHTATCGNFSVKISQDGINWTELASFDKTSTGTDKDNPGTFSNATISLDAYAGNTVMLQFFANANYGSGAIFVDNVDIHEAPDCLKPLELAVVDSLTTTTSVQLDWLPQGAEQNWLVQYKKSSDTTWVYAADSVKAHPFVLTGLKPASIYDVRVAAWCDPTDSLSASLFSNAIRVTTACAAITEFPYSENFEAIEGVTTATTNVLPICWNYINTTTYSSYVGYPLVYKGSSYAASGENTLRFYSYAYSSTYDPQDQYAILPEMEGLNALRMRFKARAYSTGSSYDATFMVGIMSNPADVATFVPVDTLTPAGTTYESFEVKFNGYNGTGKYIAIKMLAASLDDADYIHGFYMDDIVIDSIPDCYEPVAVKVLGSTATGVKFTFTPAEENTDSLSYAIVAKGAQPTEFIGVTADTMQVEGLSAGTEYELYLRSECTNSHSVAISVSFMTRLLPIDLGNGFSDDFEGALQWQIENGDLENAWVVDTAAHNGAGSTKALYISNDGGAHNAYTITAAATVFAMKPFNFAAGTYAFQYDWKANGESSYDLLRVALVPDSIQLEASSAMLPGLGSTSGNALAAALPDGWIAFDGGAKLNLATAWSTFNSEEKEVEAGTYNVVFLWRNDGSGGSQTPAAVDNFSISKVLCTKPGKPTIDKANITATTAEIIWDIVEGQTAWQIAMDTVKTFNPDSVAPIAAKDTFLAEGLLPEHTYYIYVRTNCGEDGFSAWSEGASFKTAKLCQKPDGITVSAITDSSVVVSWNAYGQTDFRLTYGIGNAYADSVDVIGDSYTITGLTENTSYKVRVASACDLTTWSVAKTFKTACAPVASVEENFDGMTGVTSGNATAECWSYLNSGTNTTYNYYPTVYAGASYAASGTNCLKFYSYYSSSATTTTEDQYAILPALNNISNLRIKFNARKYSDSYDGSFTIGVMTDPEDTATFVVIDSLHTTSTTYEQMSVMFNGYNGIGKYIAIKMDKPVIVGTATYAYRGIYIDDVVVEDIPSCIEPSKVKVQNVTSTSAQLAWTANNNESAWLVQYKQSADSVWTSINVTENPFTIDSLTMATSYDVRIAAMCSLTDTSAFTANISFKTAYGIPFEENFDSYTSLPTDEWSRYSGMLSDVLAGGELTPASIGWTFSSSTTGVFASKHVYCNIYGTSRNHWFVSPIVEATGNIQLTFNMSLSKSSTGYSAIVKDNQPDDKFAVLVSTNNGESWSVLRQWDNDSTAEYVYDDILLNDGEYAINLSGYNGPIRLALYGESTVSNGDNYLHIDNILIDTIPACPKSTGLHVEALSDSTVTLAWDAEADVTWEYGLVLDTAATFVPADADFMFVADTNVVTIDSLAENTDYLFFMRKVCGADKSVILYQAFKTSQKPVAIPFFDDFEAGNNWGLLNGDLENAWVYGSAVNNGGENALYISNDGGTTHAYTNNKAAVVFATKAIQVAEDGHYIFSYDWLAYGESTYDYIRVALVPADVQLTASTTLPSGVSTTALPTNWIALDGGSKLNLAADWQNKTVIVPVPAGLYNIVILWRDDTSTGTNPPAAIDNFSVVQAVCDAPTDLNASDITTASATLDWTSDAEAWQLAYSENAEFNPSEVTPVAVTSKPYILGNLLPETTYYYAVRTKCGDDFFSAWSAISSFSTPKECVTLFAEPDSITLCPGETITWNEVVYDQAGTYVDTLLSIDGCDSIATLVLDFYAAEETRYSVDSIGENALPFTLNVEYAAGQETISYPVGTPVGTYIDTVLVQGEHCPATLVHTLVVTSSEGIDNINANGKNAQKVIIRGIMYIYSNEEWYNANGQKVADPRF